MTAACDFVKKRQGGFGGEEAGLENHGQMQIPVIVSGFVDGLSRH